MIMTGVANTGGRIAFLEPVGKVLGLDEEAERAFGSEGICLIACPQESAATVLRPELRAARL
jgi:hypothetical protein